MKKTHAFYLFAFLSWLSYNGHAQVRLPRLISDNMVLQRDMAVKIWGWASENEHVTVRFLDVDYHTRADNAGNWHVMLDNLKAGGPYSMTISANNTIVIDNILIGDVWVCSGQSQMDISMDRVSPLYPDEIKQAGNPNLRYFQVPTAYDFTAPSGDYHAGKWESIGADNILSISAIAYFYANELYATYGIPVGLIKSSLGGSPAESWISEEGLRDFPQHLMEAHKYRSAAFTDSIEQADRQRMGSWYARLNASDLGYANGAIPWHQPETNTGSWADFEVPGYLPEAVNGSGNGVFWFRKEIEIPPALAGKPAQLNLGMLIDADSVFVNGVFTGATSYMYPPRRYKLPANLLREGENSIVIRLISSIGRGGFVPDKPYELIVDGHLFDLQGTWQFKQGAAMEALQPQTFIRWKPMGLYNGMIAPITSYGIKGVIWYQGESNTDRPEEYRRLFPAMIKDWRKNWGYEFPFLFVQLHNYMKSHDHPTESNWALTREAQAYALALPNTAMAVAIDLGEWNDIHPLNKKDVAHRLVLAARNAAYNEPEIVGSGPVFKSAEISGSKVALTFSGTGSGLISMYGSEPTHFAIAGPDKQFVWAKARIDGNRVIVWHESVSNPVAVRYAWADNPEGANLYNNEGLPAAPFRTDNW